MNAISRRGILGLTAVGLTGALTACSADGKPKAPEQGPNLSKPAPNLSQDEIKKIMSQFADSIAAADKALDVNQLAPRISGSAAEFRKAGYDLISKVPDFSKDLGQPSGEIMVSIPSTSVEFPRYAIAMVKNADPSGLPFFVGLEQKDARSPYSSWGWARQDPGVKMPIVANVEVGAAQVKLDEPGLVLKPKEALDLYATILSWGHAKDPNDYILEDPFQQGVHAEIQRVRAGINTGVAADEVATVHEDYVVKDGDFLGLRTADGGAIIMGSMTSVRTVSVRPGKKVEYKDATPVTRLLGTQTFNKELVTNYGTTVMLYIPTADSKAKIQPIGAFRYVTSVTGS